MERFLLVLVIALLSAYTNAEWTKAKAIEEKDLNIRHYDALVDEKMQTHLAYCLEQVDASGSVTQDLVYIRLDTTNVVASRKQFGLTSGCREVKISRDGMHKNMYIAFEGKRRTNLAVCNYTSSAGCYDIYTTYSADEGENWSSPMSIRRTSQNDIVERLSPHFAVNYHTGRIYLFYTQRPIAAAVPQLASASAHGGPFTTETLGNATVGRKINDAFVAVIDSTEEFYVLIEDVKQNYLLQTNNVYWWKPIAVGKESERYTKFLMYKEGKGDKMLAIGTDGKKTFTIESTDYGKSWSTRDLADSAHKFATADARITSTGTPFLAILTADFMNKKLNFFCMPESANTPSYTNVPFTETPNYGIFSPQVITPDIKEQNRRAKAFSYIWGNGTYRSIYVSDYT